MVYIQLEMVEYTNSLSYGIIVLLCYYCFANQSFGLIRRLNFSSVKQFLYGNCSYHMYTSLKYTEKQTKPSKKDANYYSEEESTLKEFETHHLLNT